MPRSPRALTASSRAARSATPKLAAAVSNAGSNAAHLAPLAELSPGSRRRLSLTLRVWLAEQGRLGHVAQCLGIHPQTVRYRLGRLRELFGDALDDQDSRFWLALALRVSPGDPPSE